MSSRMTQRPAPTSALTESEIPVAKHVAGRALETGMVRGPFCDGENEDGLPRETDRPAARTESPGAF